MSQPTSIIRARDLERRFGGKRVFSGLDVDVEEGGFLLVTGPNGSGKSTFLALCAGLLAPTAGVLDVDARREELGYLAHDPLVYRELTALENLDLYGRLYRVLERRERIGMLLERFGLWDVRHERVSTFSRGMTQRLALCRTLLHDPRLLLLDEPHSSLDADASRLVDDEFAARRDKTTIVVATHDPGRMRPHASAILALA